MMRCLLNISYIGSQFRGSQRTWGCKIFEDPTTIEGNLEIAFKKSPFHLKSHFEFSSRTDAGVHALDNAVHVDLVSKNGTPVDNEEVIFKINKYFSKNDLAIKIKQIRRVHPEFSCRRFAKSRTYLYRLGIPKDDLSYLSPNIEEWRRSWFYQRPEWDLERFKAGAALLVGRHDFETFRKVDKTGKYHENIRSIQSIDIQRSSPITTFPRLQNQDDLIEYYDVVIKAPSFIHNQIRRMIGALNSVAIGKLSLRDLQIMLQVPCRLSWPTFCKVAPSFGLYLCKVEFDPNDVLYNEEEETNNKISVASVINRDWKNSRSR